MPELSPFLRFSENELQLFALAFMALVYVWKVRWILKFNAGKERQAPTGRMDTDAKRGAVYSLFNIAMPWAMSSTRQHPLFWVQFAIFHTGVAISIAMSFLIPYGPGLIAHPYIVYALQALFATAFLIGTGRFIRRLVSPYMRAISAPDDYFSLGLLVVWFGFALMAAPNRPEQGEFWLTGYFLLTAFFLIYVPFSKISHYIFYPFTRWYLGRTLGHRGVYPMPIDPEAVKRTFFQPSAFIPGKDK
jgi:nitrate reductase gamma subunit